MSENGCILQARSVCIARTTWSRRRLARFFTSLASVAHATRWICDSGACHTLVSGDAFASGSHATVLNSYCVLVKCRRVRRPRSTSIWHAPLCIFCISYILLFDGASIQYLELFTRIFVYNVDKSVDNLFRIRCYQHFVGKMLKCFT